MSVTDELLQANEAYASSFNQSDLPMPPARVAVRGFVFDVDTGNLDEVT